jgi:hypothetical protein
MSREETLKCLREIFQGYLETKRSLAANADRVYLKGWPDRRIALQALSRATSLVIAFESMRLEYLLTHVPLESPVWTSLQTITERLHAGWQPDDENALSLQNPAYQHTMRELEAIEKVRNNESLAGPFKDARRDPDYAAACNAFAKANQELDRRFAALRLNWPRDEGR